MSTAQASGFFFNSRRFPHVETGFLSGLILDYISEEEQLKAYYNRFPRLENFSDQIHEKQDNYKHREALVAALKGQYAAQKLSQPSLDLLLSDRAFTLCTGHQLCLLTGPLYFIYKICTCIKACRMLEKNYPANRFLPVFWMASEDHDFEEANHFFLLGKTLEWESGQGGAVGRMRNEGIEEVLSALKELTGIAYGAAQVQQLFEGAYLRHRTVSAASRYLVHTLFGHAGLICIDGDDPALKAMARPMFEEELLKQPSRAAVAQSNEGLSAMYHVQAHAREINLFMLQDEHRGRIIRRESGDYSVDKHGDTYSEEAIIQMLRDKPEAFSPNVILRPLYQEIVLPNLAYIGGGGEIAYWLQLKDLFAHFGVTMPMLMLRNSAWVVDEGLRELIMELGLDYRDLFAPREQVIQALLSREKGAELHLAKSREEAQELFEKVKEKMASLDPMLIRSASAAAQRVDNLLHKLEKKMMRAEKRKQSTCLQRTEAVYEALYPGGSLQERKLNFAQFYMPYGSDFIDALIRQFDPFDFSFEVLEVGVRGERS